MRFLYIGDPHLKISQLDDAEKFKDQTVKIIEQGQFEAVVIAGDLFDTFGVIRAEILSIWNGFFRRVSKSGKKIFVLVGNHDMSGADGGAHPLEVFKECPNTYIIDDKLNLPYQNCYFLPFYRDKIEFEAECRQIPAGSYLFCHQSFNGATFENGFYDPHGADPAAVSHLKAVISGHVHKAQRFENIFYPGTPYQHTFSDFGESKGIFEIELNASELGYEVVRTHILDMPVFIVLSAETVPELQTLIEKSTPVPNAHYKLVAKGTPSEIAQFWNTAQVQEFKSKAKRVVDALTSMKPITAFLAVKGKDQSEKLDEYIKQRSWRTSAESLAQRAKEYLAS